MIDNAATPSASLDPAIKGCRILIIDDDLTSRILLQQILSSRGYRCLSYAEDGEEGLERLAEIDPDLILLDLAMPKLDGYTFCQRVREQPAFRELPILVQTGHGDTESRVRAFAAGATDFVTKPLLAEEILARVNIHLSNSHLITQLRSYRERVSHELESARQMQQELIPTAHQVEELHSRYGLDISHHYLASSELGGDYYGFIPIDDHRVGLFLGDFAGHGIGAAVNTFRMQVLMREVQRQATNPHKYLTALNHRLCRFLSLGQFTTLIYAVLDLEHWTLEYASAAATKPLLIQQDSVEVLSSAGTPLGVIRDGFDVESYRIQLPNDGALLFYSDALIEERNANGEMFGREQLIELLESDIDISSRRRLARVEHALTTHRGQSTPSDDLTLVSIGFHRQGRVSQWCI